MAPLVTQLRARIRTFGVAEGIFIFLLAAWAALWLAWPGGLLEPLAWLAMILSGAWVGVRLLRRAVRTALWRLRNRLYIAYVFIAFVPVALILTLAGLGAWMFASQTALYLVVSELDRRVDLIRAAAQFVVRMPAEGREESIRQLTSYYRSRFPGFELLLKDGVERRYPEDAAVTAPPEGWGEAGGILLKERRLYGWAHARNGSKEATVLAPFTADYLSGMVPGLGEVDYLPPVAPDAPAGARPARPPPGGPHKGRLPSPVNRLDFVVWWFSSVPAALWGSPGKTRGIVLTVRSRPSAVYRTVASQKADVVEDLLPVVFAGVAVLFLIVELISLFIGVSLTRTITRAVHGLYEGTRKVREGDFSHRIQADGSDQLAELAASFNSMTGNLERLVAVAKEKERLQAEIEIAREVQYQLYPRVAPELGRLRLKALCNPARMVSGDYYDYQALGPSMLALAIGDVAGKGISAALLMATVESSVRTQIRHCLDAAAGDGSAPAIVSTSKLVAQLNQHLFAHTSPEKYATFWFGVYDEQSSVLTYTNAGHLPPILLRKGQATLLEINGMVVGAFPFAEYDESRLKLESGDVLVCYTDGVTEPENEYGEMFGEQRLIEIVAKNADRDNDEIIASVMESVRQWTGSPELQDDMTLLVARRE